MPKKTKRTDLVPKKCSRCGNDFSIGCFIFNLPYEKKYVAFCKTCVLGLKEELVEMIEHNKFPLTAAIKNDDDWKKFWKEEV